MHKRRWQFQVVVQIVVQLLNSALVVDENDDPGAARNDVLHEHIFQRIAFLVVVDVNDVLSNVLVRRAGATDGEMDVTFFHEGAGQFEGLLWERGAEHEKAAVPVLVDVYDACQHSI